MLRRLGFLVGGLAVGLGSGAIQPAWAHDGYGPAGFGSVSPLPAGALLTVGTEASAPIAAGTAATEGQQAATAGRAPEPVAASPEQTAGSGPAGSGPAAGSGNGCVLTLSDLPQTQPGGAYYDVACPAADGNLPSGLQSQGTVWVPRACGRGQGRGGARCVAATSRRSGS